jgi:hypothetical protein
MTAASVGILVALVAGGSYALASGSKTIKACVHHQGGDIYVAKKCAKHDKKLSWNTVGPKGATGAAGATGATGARGATGPQGPGAGYLVYNAAGTASPTETQIGKIGPFTFTGTCSASAGNTGETIRVTEAGAQLDGLIVQSGGASPVSQSLSALSDGIWDSASNTTTTPTTVSDELLIIPSSGTAVHYQETFSVTGGATNTCHFSATGTPSAAGGLPSAARAVHPGTGTARPSSGMPKGLTIAGRSIG